MSDPNDSGVPRFTPDVHYRTAPLAPPSERRIRWQVSFQPWGDLLWFGVIYVLLLAYECAQRFIREGATPVVTRSAAVLVVVLTVGSLACLRIQRVERVERSS